MAVACQKAGWDVERDTIAKIEGRTRWVSDFELVILARLFRVPLDSLLPAGRATNETVRDFLARAPSGRS